MLTRDVHERCVHERARDEAPVLVVLRDRERHERAGGVERLHADVASDDARADFEELVDERQRVEGDEDAGDHFAETITIRASSSEIACRSSPTWTVTGPPIGAFSSTRTRAPGRSPISPR